MATIKATYRVYNGTSWDDIYFKTSAGQVGESNGTLNFLRPDTHKVNGKSFWSGTDHQGITLYAGDIYMDSNEDTLIDEFLYDVDDRVEKIEGYCTTAGVNPEWIDVGGVYQNLEESFAAFQSLAEFITEANNSIVNINNTITSNGFKYGIAVLNGAGKVPSSMLPDTILGQMTYMGLFDASNTQATIVAGVLAEGPVTRKLPTETEIMIGGLNASTYYTPTKGDYFIVKTAGTFNNIALNVGDWLVFNGVGNSEGLGWEKVDNTDAVSSVAGLTGAISAVSLAGALKGTTATTLAAGDHSHKPADLISEWTINGVKKTNVDDAIAALNNYIDYALDELTIDGVQGELNGNSPNEAFGIIQTKVLDTYRRIYSGSATPSGMKSGDIWLQYS